MSKAPTSIVQSAVASQDDHNHIELCGRLAAPAELRDLPSGDVLLTWRLTVTRPSDARGSVDSIDCSSTRARVVRTVRAADPGDRLALTGALRRRFWRGAAGPQSRYTVEVETARRVTSGRRAAASRDRTQALA